MTAQFGLSYELQKKIQCRNNICYNLLAIIIDSYVLSLVFIK